LIFLVLVLCLIGWTPETPLAPAHEKLDVVEAGKEHSCARLLAGLGSLLMDLAGNVDGARWCLARLGTKLAVPASVFAYLKLAMVAVVAPRHTAGALLLIGFVRHVLDVGLLPIAASVAAIAGSVRVALLCVAVLLCDALMVSSGLHRAFAVYSTAAVPISTYVVLRLLCKVRMGGAPRLCINLASSGLRHSPSVSRVERPNATLTCDRAGFASK
jgi:hypothetical protein